MSSGKRFGLVAAVIIAAIIAFVIAKPGGDDKSKSTSTATSTGSSGKAATPPPYTQVRVVGGNPAGGIEKIKVNKGDRVRLAVTSDVADEIHIHGYDIMRDVPAGGTVKFNFPATIDGSFVIELETRGEQIAELEVEP
jgi:FtsP/CotA-like multicopper oxidase with cupredoxin domain